MKIKNLLEVIPWKPEPPVGGKQGLFSGVERSKGDTRVYKGSRENPELLYVKSALPVIKDTDKVMIRGTDMFYDEGTGRNVFVGVCRDIGGAGDLVKPPTDDFTRTY